MSVKDRPWKYQMLADIMLEIHAEDICNDTYGRVRMFQALTLKQPDGIPIPSERTVYRFMEKIGLSHRPKRNPKGITKADREARKSDDLLSTTLLGASLTRTLLTGLQLVNIYLNTGISLSPVLQAVVKFTWPVPLTWRLVRIYQDSAIHGRSSG